MMKLPLPRSRAPLIATLATLVVLAAVAVALVADRVAERTIPAILPGLDDTAFTLQSAAGPVSNSDLLGVPTALFFGFTQCPEICPTTMVNLTGLAEEAQEDVGGDAMRIVFITVDPERDTPQLLAEYIEGLGARHAIGLSGETGDVARVLEDFRIYSRKVPLEGGDYTMDHTASVFLYDRAGHLAGTIAYNEPFDVARQKIKNLLAE